MIEQALGYVLNAVSPGYPASATPPYEPPRVAAGEQVTISICYATGTAMDDADRTVTVDWGDSSRETVTMPSSSGPAGVYLTHTYLSGGTFPVTVTGSAGGVFAFQNFGFEVVV